MRSVLTRYQDTLAVVATRNRATDTLRCRSIVSASRKRSVFARCQRCCFSAEQAYSFGVQARGSHILTCSMGNAPGVVALPSRMCIDVEQIIVAKNSECSNTDGMIVPDFWQAEILIFCQWRSNTRMQRQEFSYANADEGLNKSCIDTVHLNVDTASCVGVIQM